MENILLLSIFSGCYTVYYLNERFKACRNFGAKTSDLEAAKLSLSLRYELCLSYVVGIS